MKPLFKNFFNSKMAKKSITSIHLAYKKAERWSVLNLLGQEVYTSKIENTNSTICVDMSSLSVGTYMVKIKYNVINQ